jgi:hypothetical protein
VDRPPGVPVLKVSYFSHCIRIEQRNLRHNLQGYITYVIHYFCKTDSEERIVNSIQLVSTIKIVVHYAVMVQSEADVYRLETCQI